MSEAREFLTDLLRRLDSSGSGRDSIPEASPDHAPRRMCVGMATYDDFDGVWFTIQAIRMFHPEMADKLCFLIVDNHPEGPAAADLKALDEAIPFLRYVPFAGFRSTAVRDLIFREANAEIVCCVDCHLLLRQGALAAIDRWFDDHPSSRDLIQGPLMGGHLEGNHATHFEPTWGAGMYGRWALDPRATDENNEPFEIEMQGLGLFACRRDAWPGINPRFRGFGGEEGYLHEKVRRAGGRVLCHPKVGWVHRFSRPAGPPYRPSWENVMRNYLIGWDELDWDTSEVALHFREQFAAAGMPERFEAVLDQATREALNAFSFFDGIFCLNLDQDTQRWGEAHRRHEELGIAWQVERFSAVETPDNHHRGNAMSFRRMVQEAQRRGYECLLILEDDAVFHERALPVMRAASGELPAVEWDLCYLGACVWSQSFDLLPGSRVLQECGPVTCTHAVAIHRRAYARILADIPDAEPEFERWLTRETACDQYLSRRIADGTFRALITSPRIASQPALLRYEDADLELAEHYGR
jgi:hypothetical protein